jgi:hypothetical protein
MHAFHIPPSERSEFTAEVTAASRWLSENVPILSGFDHHFLRSLALAVECRKFAPGAVVRPEGGDGHFWVVLKGRVLVGARAGDAPPPVTGYPTHPSLDSCASMLADAARVTLDEPYVLQQGGSFGTLGIVAVSDGGAGWGPAPAYRAAECAYRTVVWAPALPGSISPRVPFPPLHLPPPPACCPGSPALPTWL